TGLFMYDELAGRRNIGRHHRLNREEVLEGAQCLTPDGLKMGFRYFDAQTDDTRLTMAVLRAAAARGALLANYCEAFGFEHEGGRAEAVWAREVLAAAGSAVHPELLLRARHIVNATGVWAEQTELLAGDAPKLSVAPSKGTHLVFAKEAFRLGD